MFIGSRDLLKFWKMSDNVSEAVQDRDMVATEVKCMWPIEWHHCQCH